eukprot:PhF_6_TR42640/c3_g1_i3/m.64152
MSRLDRSSRGDKGLSSRFRKRRRQPLQHKQSRQHHQQTQKYLFNKHLSLLSQSLSPLCILLLRSKPHPLQHQRQQHPRTLPPPPHHLSVLGFWGNSQEVTPTTRPLPKRLLLQFLQNISNNNPVRSLSTHSF